MLCENILENKEKSRFAIANRRRKCSACRRTASALRSCRVGLPPQDRITGSGLVDKAIARRGSNVEGRDADELMKALATGRGPERVLDFMLRTGPYGDGFGADPDGLSLAVLEANPHGVDLGPGHDVEGTNVATAAGHAGVDSNVLARSDLFDPLSGNAVFSGIPVELAPE